MNMGHPSLEMVAKNSSLDWKQSNLAAISRLVDEEIDDVAHRMVMKLFLDSAYDIEAIAYFAGEARETILQIIACEGERLEQRAGWSLSTLKRYCMGY